MADKTIVTNEHGVQIDYDVAVNLMVDELREVLYNEIAPCTAQQFFDTYAAAHAQCYGTWELSKPNPVY